MNAYIGEHLKATYGVIAKMRVPAAAGGEAFTNILVPAGQVTGQGVVLLYQQPNRLQLKTSGEPQLSTSISKPEKEKPTGSIDPPPIDP